MKIIFKNTLWFTVKTTLCLIVVALSTTIGCERSETLPKACDFENSLSDLPWLKAKIDEFTLLLQKNPTISVSVYQCVYGNGETGFLINENNTKTFYNCNGEILCLMGGFAGETCSELNIVSEELIWEIKGYPIEIPITRYSFASTCQWTNFFYNKLIIINSDEALRDYVTCIDDNYPEIDFSKWTLLVFSPSCCNIDSRVKKMLLEQLSDSKYLLSIDIIPSDTTNAAPLIISILIPKISDSSQIELNVTTIQN